MNDEHHGKGGSYRRDPATGKRTLIERTEDKAAEAIAPTAAEAKPARKKPVAATEGSEGL